MTQIHPTALVDPKAELADDVRIGAYSIVRAGVSIGAGTVVHEHSHLHGNTRIGKNGRIGPSAFIGLPPQHLKMDGEGCWLIIGDNVTIRETATVHRSIYPGEENATRLGNNCFLMGGSHVGHNCVLGEHVVLANLALLGGHCVLGERVFIGGASAVHQWVRVGRLTMMAGCEASSHDMPPFCAVRYRGLKGYNAIGCKRAGMTQQSIHAVRSTYHCIHTHRTVPAAVNAIRTTVPLVPEVIEILDFIASSKRGILPSVRFRNLSGVATVASVATNNIGPDPDDIE